MNISPEQMIAVLLELADLRIQRDRLLARVRELEVTQSTEES